MADSYGDVQAAIFSSSRQQKPSELQPTLLNLCLGNLKETFLLRTSKPEVGLARWERGMVKEGDKDRNADEKTDIIQTEKTERQTETGEQRNRENENK